MKTFGSVLAFLLATSLFAGDKADPLPEFGKLKSVGKGRITLVGTEVLKKGQNSPAKPPETTLTVSPDARIILDGKAAELADLKTNAGIRYRVDKAKTVVEIDQTTIASNPSGITTSGFGGSGTL